VIKYYLHCILTEEWVCHYINITVTRMFTIYANHFIEHVTFRNKEHVSDINLSVNSQPFNDILGSVFSDQAYLNSFTYKFIRTN